MSLVPTFADHYRSDVLQPRLASLGVALGVSFGLTQVSTVHANTLEWSITRTIPATGAAYPTLSPDDQTLYVGDFDTVAPNQRLWIIDVTTSVATAVTDSLLNRPAGSAVSADGSTLLVANRVAPGSVVRMDTASRVFASTGIASTDTPAPNGPLTISVTPDGTVALVAIQNSSSVGFLRMSDVTAIRAPVSLGGPTDVRQIAITGDGATAYITAAGSDVVVVMDVATTNIDGTIPVGDLPNGIAITPDGSQAWVANTNGDSISIIDLRSDSVIETIAMQSSDAPFGIAFTPDGRSALIANRDSGTVAIIDRSSRIETQRLNVGGEPRGVVVTGDGLRAFVGADDAGIIVLEFPPTPASGPDTPTAPMQQFGRLQNQTCTGLAPEFVNWPGFGPRPQQEGWGESWAQWPNGGTGGFVCTRQPFYTTTDSWAAS